MRISPGSPTAFDYETAFSRNIGWMTEWEQQQLRKKTVAIAGLGGVGGAHALTLTRLGIGGFHFADFDRFDVVNLNRQSGAFISTVNLEKTAVMAQMTKDVNPELHVRLFPRGVTEENLDDFLFGVDLFVDGLDFFVLSIRRKLFKRCAEFGIPAITAAPIGFGAGCLVFMPGGMTFEEYFRFEGLSEAQQYVNFAVGLTPKGFHRAYLVDPSRLDLANRRAPSTTASIQLCAGIVAAEATKILLGRGKVEAVPVYHQFDAYRGKWHRGSLRYGNAGPLQSLKRQIGYKAFAQFSLNARPAEVPVTGSDMMRILDLARWAPSGDNAQPWKFEIVAEDKVLVRIHTDGEERNIYDYANGQPTLISAGLLLETIRIAASSFGRAMRWSYLGSNDAEGGGSQHTIEVMLPKNADVSEDPLCPYIAIRSVDRRAYRSRRLTESEKGELEAALGSELRLQWRESLAERWALARLCASSTDIRLRLPEAYDVHQRILDWNRPFSRDGVPAAALGASPMMLGLMRWVLQKWSRVQFMNRYLAGTLMPRVELDFIPGVRSAGYFIVTRKIENGSRHEPEALLRSGERLQRVWLTVTRLGLVMQPALAPLCFSHYAQTEHPRLSRFPRVARLAKTAARCFADAGPVLFLARIGEPQKKCATSRSIRRDLTALIDKPN